MRLVPEDGENDELHICECTKFQLTSINNPISSLKVLQIGHQKLERTKWLRE